MKATENRRLVRFIKYVPQAAYADLPVFILNHSILRKVSYLFYMIPNLRFLSKKKTYISHIDIICTTRCTLNCKHCSAHMPFFEQGFDFDTEQLISDLRRLLASFDRIGSVSLIGGEPLLYPNADKILSVLVAAKNIKSIRLVTNGTMIPKSEALISLLQNKKVTVHISDYGQYSKKLLHNELQTFLQEHHIRYRCPKVDFWLDYGGETCYHSSSEELKAQYDKCIRTQGCFCFYDGRLYQCAKAAFGTAVGIVPENPAETIDFRDESSTIPQLREQIASFLYDTPYIKACDYCNAGTERCVRIPVGEQAERAGRAAE